MQRTNPRCVTAHVRQITETAAFNRVLDISPPHTTCAAIRCAAPARRAPGPGRRTSGKVGATSDALAARRSRVTPGRSPHPGPVGPGWCGAGLRVAGSRHDPVGCARRRGAGGIDRDGTVTAATPPATVHRPARERAVRRSGPGGRRRPPGIRCRTVQQFPLRTADSFPCGFVAIGRKGVTLTSSSCARRSFRDGRIPVAVMRGLTSSSCAPRAPSGRRAVKPGPRRLCTAVRAAQEVVEADLARCGRGSPGVIPSLIDDRSRCASAAPPSSRAPALW